jgi:hypothetical protein
MRFTFTWEANLYIRARLSRTNPFYKKKSRPRAFSAPRPACDFSMRMWIIFRV